MKLKMLKNCLWINIIALTLSFSAVNNIYAISSQSPLSDRANKFLVFYMDQMAGPLNNISTMAKLFYQNYGSCPSDNSFKMSLPSNSNIDSATNRGCVAVATFKPKGVPKPLELKRIAIGPQYVSSTNQWNFGDMLIASDIRGNSKTTFAPLSGSSSHPLNLSDNYIGALFASDPVGFLQSTGTKARPDTLGSS